MKFYGGDDHDGNGHGHDGRHDDGKLYKKSYEFQYKISEEIWDDEKI